MVPDDTIVVTHCLFYMKAFVLFVSLNDIDDGPLTQTVV